MNQKDLQKIEDGQNRGKRKTRVTSTTLELEETPNSPTEWKSLSRANLDAKSSRQKRAGEKVKEKNARERVATWEISQNHYIVQLQLFVLFCIGRGSKWRLRLLQGDQTLLQPRRVWHQHWKHFHQLQEVVLLMFHWHQKQRKLL